jgi:hypothetical protein
MSENAAEDLLVKVLLQYPHRLTQEDRQHLAKLKQEIMSTPLLTLEEALNSQHEDGKPIEVSREDFEAGLDYIFGFTGTALPETFQHTHLRELDEIHKIVAASLVLRFRNNDQVVQDVIQSSDK